MEKTFNELIIEKTQLENFFMLTDVGEKFMVQLMQKVREATIAEAVNYCVSQDWIKTIDNLKNIPTDRILDFENQRKL